MTAVSPTDSGTPNEWEELNREWKEEGLGEDDSEKDRSEDEGEELRGENPTVDQKVLPKPELVTPEEEERHRALGHPHFRALSLIHI